MIVLFTDFGLEGPYIGQVKARLWRDAPEAKIIDLFSDAPSTDPKPAAYLLAAYVDEFPPGTVFLGVVDPGVGSDRPGVVVEADGRWFVGPGNGLFELVTRRARNVRKWMQFWDNEKVSASFHGRDVFAPIAARLERGESPPGELKDQSWNSFPDWPNDLAEIVYFDCYGNAMTGLRKGFVNPTFVLKANGVYVHSARTFADVSVGSPFWYVNSNGLVEIAVNRGSAAHQLGLRIGMPIGISDPSRDMSGER